MRRARGTGLLPALATFCAGGASQALTPHAQDRHVFTSHDVFSSGHTEELKSAPDFGPFTAGVDGIIFPIEGPPLASQSSVIEAERLQASGNTLANPPAVVGEGHTIHSDSAYTVDFVL